MITKTHYQKNRHKKAVLLMAGIPGFEPRLTESESAVLPLDDIPLNTLIITYPILLCKHFLSLFHLFSFRNLDKEQKERLSESEKVKNFE